MITTEEVYMQCTMGQAVEIDSLKVHSWGWGWGGGGGGEGGERNHHHLHHKIKRLMMIKSAVERKPAVGRCS